MTLTKETGRRGSRHHTRYWDMGDRWEMCARKCGSHYIWSVYHLDDQRPASVSAPTFYSKAEALAFHKAAA